MLKLDVMMKHLKEFTIPFVGLKLGKHHFKYQIDKTFFEHFEYEEFNDTSINVGLSLNKKTTLLELDFDISGTVNINCDLTNEAYNQEISNQFNLVVNFGEEFNDEEIDLLIIPHGEYEINIQQYIYELIVLAVPTKRIHPGVKDGTLNSDILKKLEELSPKLKENKETEEETDPRWNTLKKLLTDK
ncbi:uncharacterized metal-binding protein YceD (DUF177 family) [Xanthomarina spongicola]|uniref:Uncharacterized metal-binding protein YceD (DUF177 family) n=2 Tax=Xanthomarina spongicola TaxID=570520 RepID=A0A316DVB2_9FLAO|nr:uncharacterized metal-binding protein YceD (DUF177 family) [Xanthomarina spongicola]